MLYRLVLLFCALFSVFQSANACSCSARASIEDEIKGATAVFIGKPISKGRNYTHFEVQEILAGTLSDEVSIYHGVPYSGSCGVEFRENEVVHIVAYKTRQGTLETSMCSSGFSTEEYLKYIKLDGAYIGLSEACAQDIVAAYANRIFNEGKFELMEPKCEAAVELFDERYPKYEKELNEWRSNR